MTIKIGDMNIKELQKQLDANWEKEMEVYNNRVAALKKEKEQFIKDNPDFPNPEVLFLNVIAPPKRLIFQEIT
jgi:ApbE superfamily uncharacterized protein (UPF0280 family)